MNELLSGMSSRLFERVREDKGMAYYVGSTRVLGLRDSMFVLYAGTHPDGLKRYSRKCGELARIAAGDVLAMNWSAAGRQKPHVRWAGKRLGPVPCTSRSI